MKKLFDRFYNWIYHVSVRRNTANHGRALLYRYPSPGSMYVEKVPEDYRTPFQQTHYNVRYADLTDKQIEEQRSISLGVISLDDPVKKLIALKFLKQQDKANPTAINDARARYQNYFGQDVNKSMVINDFNIKLPNSLTHQGLRKWYEQNGLQQAIKDKYDSNFDQKEHKNNPNVMEFQHLDLYDAPHFQQNRIWNSYEIDGLQKARRSDPDGLITKEGSANFWKALDDSNDPKNVRKVQGKIGDPTPTDFSLQKARIKFQFDKDGNVIDIHRIKSKQN